MYNTTELTTEFKRVLDLVWIPNTFTPTYSSTLQKWSSITTNLSASQSRTLMLGMPVTSENTSFQTYSEINNSARNNPRKVLGYEGGAGTATGSIVKTWFRSPNMSSVFAAGQPKSFSNAPFVTEHEGAPYIYLNSSILGSMVNLYLNGDGHMNAPNTGADGPELCSIPIPTSVPRTENIVYTDPDHEKWFKFGGNLDFPQMFDMYLTLGVASEQVPLDLNGQSFIVKLGVLTNKKEFERTFPSSTAGGYERVRNLIVTK
jgi:hypothetical protein